MDPSNQSWFENVSFDIMLASRPALKCLGSAWGRLVELAGCSRLLMVPYEQLTMTQDGYLPRGYGDTQGKVHHAGNQFTSGLPGCSSTRVNWKARGQSIHLFHCENMTMHTIAPVSGAGKSLFYHRSCRSGSIIVEDEAEIYVSCLKIPGISAGQRLKAGICGVTRSEGDH